MHSLLVIVNGLPAVGKTTLAQKLARDLSLPLLGKDDIKEALFDSLGIEDRPWAIKLGLASVETLFRLLEVQLQARLPGIIIENAFWPEYHNARLTEMINRQRASALQVWCSASLEVTHQREMQRCSDGTRHPGHACPPQDFTEYQTLLETRGYGRLDIPADLFEIDLTEANQADYLRLRKKISLLLVA